MLQYDIGSVVIGEGLITSLEFHRDGRWLVMTTNESSIHLIDSLAGEEKKKLYCKSSGIGKMVYTHHESCVLTSAEKSNKLRYLCMYDNRVIRDFNGHTGTIKSLSMSPIDDCFISADSEKLVCLWNLSVSQPTAKLQLPPHMENCSASFDRSGLVFGVMCYDSWKKVPNLKLFDARNFEAGPFQSIVPDSTLMESAVLKTSPSLTSSQAQKLVQSNWQSFEFSSDGNHILINTQSDLVMVLDGFREDVEPVAILRKNDNSIPLGACFSSNSKFVYTANDDNELLILDKATGEPRAAPHPGHVAPVGCIRSNPKYDLIASGCINTVLWIPKDPLAAAASTSNASSTNSNDE